MVDSQAVPKISLTGKPTCIHYWLIEGSHVLHPVSETDPVSGEVTIVDKPNGARSPGICRKCGERKMFRNSTPTLAGYTSSFKV